MNVLLLSIREILQIVGHCITAGKCNFTGQ